MFDNLNFQAFLLDPFTAKRVNGIYRLKEFLEQPFVQTFALGADRIDSVKYQGQIFGLEIV